MTDAEVGAACVRHLRTLVIALDAAVANTPYECLKTGYREALADLRPLAETIAKYDTPGHNEPSEVRYVSSSDSAGSGDEISGLKVDRGQPCEVP